MIKSYIRKEIINKLKNNRHGNVVKVYAKLFSSYGWINSNSVAVNVSLPFEFDTKPIIRRALKDNKRIFVPKVMSKESMIFVECDEKTRFTKSSFNIYEPICGKGIRINDIELIIVPGLAFSIETGDRLGFGGGYYDRILKEYHGNTVSLGFSEQIYQKPIWKVDDFDQKVKTIIY